MKMSYLQFPCFQLLVIFFIFCWQAPSGEAQTDVPQIIGTWKINLAKSNYDPGPPPKSHFQMWTWDGEFLTHSTSGVNANGVRSNGAHWAAKFDGKDYPIFGSGSGNDSVSLKRIDAYTSEVVSKKGGKETLTYRHAVSRDGKTLTITVKGISGRGRRRNDVMVMDRPD